MESLTLYSNIPPKTLEKLLFLGSIKTVLGALLLCLGGVFLPPHLLEVIGLPLFFGSVFLLVWGLLPYQKAKLLVTHPTTIHLFEEFALIDRYQKKSITLLYEEIKEVTLHLDGTLQFLLKGKNKTLSLSYFSKKDLKEIQEVLFAED